MSLDEGTQTPQLDGDLSLEAVFYPVYQWLFDEDSEFVSNVERKLAQARMPNNVEMYLSRSIAVGILVGLGLWVLGMLAGWAFVQFFVGDQIIGVPLPDSLSTVADIIRLPLVVLISGLVFGSIGFAIGFGSLVSMPYIRATSREREINTLLADSISFMYALSVGGMNQLEVVRAIAKAEDTYGEVAQEFQSIVLETEYFDTDYRTAVQNQALETPSDEFAQFLTDMLSILDSGGDMTSFLEDQKDKHMRTAKQEQQKQLDTLELFGEMYMTLSLFPLLLIILLVIMSLMGGGGQDFMLYATVYGLIPLVGVAFLVLVSTVTQDELGDGYLRPGAEEDYTVDDGIGMLDTGLVDEYAGEHDIFDKIKSREGSYELAEILRKPHLFFRDNPLFVLLVTVPITLVVLAGAVIAGSAPTGLEGMKNNVIWGGFIWVYTPVYLNMLPLAVFHEWNVRSRRSVIGELSENLRKLASANDTGMTLLESIRVVAEASSGKLADEFETIHTKVNYGTNLKDALREFNNKYHIPRLARTIKLVSEAQETSSQIQDVLSTAATSAENQDDIDRERKARTRMQMVIIIMTYVTLLAVMALLQVQFLDTMAGLMGGASGDGGGSDQALEQFAGGLDPGLLSMLFFHAVTIQALISAFVAGYIRSVDIISGAKYAVVLSTLALVTWVLVEQAISGDSGSEEQAGLLLLVGSTGWSALDPVRTVRDWLSSGDPADDDSSTGGEVAATDGATADARA
jgi:flagellar protein FlaJ